MQVYMGRVLLTGTVDTPEMRAEAVKLAWTAEGVKEVINEIQLAGAAGASGFARDTWISTQLKSALLFDKQDSNKWTLLAWLNLCASMQPQLQIMKRCAKS